MATLPNTYQELEYIESTGTQYINTGRTPSSNYVKVVANMTFNGGVNSTTAVFFGMAGSSSTMYSLHKNPNWQINAGSNNNTSIGTYSNGNLNVEYITNNGSYSVKLGASTYSGSYSGSVAQSTRPMYIFAFNEMGSTTRLAYAKLYSFKIYSSATTLVRDFVPCYRKSDGVIGLYDLVNSQFYTNAGTGTFNRGGDAKHNIIKRIYVGTNLVRPLMKWTLYKETDFKNSSFGGFRTAGWYNASSPSYTGMNTTDGYIYSTRSHSRCKICPDTNDLALFQSAKAIKIVTDGIMVGNNSNTYNSWVGLGGNRQEYGKKRSGMNYPTLLSGTALTYGVWYKSETILTKEDSLITTLDNGSSYGITYESGLWNRLVSTSSNSYFYPSASDGLMCLAEVALDNGTTSYLKDVHVYLLF